MIANYHVVPGIETLSSGRIANALDCRVTPLVPAFLVFILKDLRTLHLCLSVTMTYKKRNPNKVFNRKTFQALDDVQKGLVECFLLLVEKTPVKLYSFATTLEIAFLH